MVDKNKELRALQIISESTDRIDARFDLARENLDPYAISKRVSYAYERLTYDKTDNHVR